jgi:hypothetical protein
MTILKASAYPKFKSIPRLHRRVVLTEKVDGTNGLIDVTRLPDAVPLMDPQYLEGTTGVGVTLFNETDNRYERFIVRAGSRNRWLSPDNDNFGFARWVWDNAISLAGLGEGKHYGEWFGQGIQSGYGLTDKRFALFNVNRWYDARDSRIGEDFHQTFPKAVPAPPEVTVVPVVSVIDGKHLNYAVDDALHTLESEGSIIAPGFKNPEGVVVFHEAAGVLFKATIKNDESPKSAVKSK